MICKLLTENVIMGLPLSILQRNTHAEWVNLVQNDCPEIIGEESESYPLLLHNSVSRRLIEMQKIALQGHPAPTPPSQPMLVLTMPGVTETSNGVIDNMTFATHFTLIHLLHTENVDVTHEDLNSSLEQPENQWNIRLVLYDTLTSRAKPSSNSQLSHCSWSFGIFDDSHRY
jgi:hypothetical protein